MSKNMIADIEAARTQIYRWAYRLLQNDHDALDATQSVLMKTLNTPIVVPEKRMAWLRRVTINHCIDLIRQRRVISDPSEVIEKASAELDDLEKTERRDRIVAAMQRLTEPQRIVLVSKVYDGETFEAIADVMDISASSVKTHYVRALRKMREWLAPFKELEP